MLNFGLLEKSDVVLIVDLALGLSLIVAECPAWAALQSLGLLEGISQIGDYLTLSMHHRLKPGTSRVAFDTKLLFFVCKNTRKSHVATS